MCFSYSFWNSICHFKVDLKKGKKKNTKDFETEQQVKILNFRPDDIFWQIPNYSFISPKEIWFGLFKLIAFSLLLFASFINIFFFFQLYRGPF